METNYKTFAGLVHTAVVDWERGEMNDRQLATLVYLLTVGLECKSENELVKAASDKIAKIVREIDSLEE